MSPAPGNQYQPVYQTLQVFSMAALIPARCGMRNRPGTVTMIVYDFTYEPLIIMSVMFPIKSFLLSQVRHAEEKADTVAAIVYDSTYEPLLIMSTQLRIHSVNFNRHLQPSSPTKIGFGSARCGMRKRRAQWRRSCTMTPTSRSSSCPSR